ncbi:unnamed protein product [Dibothriocephalus latus]|uniref:Endonuclease/exonuclease/phosphatase domain-containing protein n=1 Tax=Dibothriocephalus latus TaxID=60516 RepID=A0A3P6PTA1_DIBLA|nr:unnamed protein product [Dibothriocephalus latus]
MSRYNPEKAEKAIIGRIYNSLNSSSEDDEKLFEIFKLVSEPSFDAKIITEDFYYPEIEWLSNCCPPRFQAFLGIINFSNWSQLVCPQRRDYYILDLIFTKDMASLFADYKRGFFQSDHTLIHCCLPVAYTRKASTVRTYYDFDLTDIHLINNFVDSLDWRPLSSTNNVKILCDFMAAISNSILEFVPIKNAKPYTSDPTIPRFLLPD